MTRSGNAREPQLPACARTWHVDERRWLGEFRIAVSQEAGSGVKDIIVYGSKARGDDDAESDIDILVIVRNDAGSLEDTLGDIAYELAVGSHAVPSIMTQTEGEWEQLRERRSPFLTAVERDGISVL